jgi:hypothetical protein
MLRNLGVEVSQATDVFAVYALRNLLFAGLVGGGVDAVDLIAIDIQRQYDVGLGSLNQTRKAIDLNPYNSISDLLSDTKLRAEFLNAGGSIKNVDLFMGGLAEKHAKNALVGETFKRSSPTSFGTCGPGTGSSGRTKGSVPRFLTSFPRRGSATSLFAIQIRQTCRPMFLSPNRCQTIHITYQSRPAFSPCTAAIARSWMTGIKVCR